MYDWRDPIILSLIAVTIVSAFAFVLVERRTAEPIIPLHLFKDLNFNFSTCAGTLIDAAMFGAIGYLSTYLQTALRVNATQSADDPKMGALLMSSVVSGQLVSNTGRKKRMPIAGSVLMAIDLVLLSTLKPGASLHEVGTATASNDSSVRLSPSSAQQWWEAFSRANWPIFLRSSCPPPQSAAAHREEEKAGSGNVLIGYGTPGGEGQSRRTRAPRKTVVAGSPNGGPVVEPAEKHDVDLSFRTRVPGKLGPVITPLVRRMAREHGVDLGAVHGSGDSGLIMRRDVEAVILPEAEVTPVVEPVETQTTTEVEIQGAVDSRTGLGISSRTPVRGVRKTVAANMSRSRAEIPEATVWVDVDDTALVELRAGLKKLHGHAAPGLLAFIARFVTAGLKRFPELNTRIETTVDGCQEMVGFARINLGFAAQTDRGLVVPSVRNADILSARELDAGNRRLTAVARDGKATPEELGSGTFTLNNYGVFGVDGSAAIINHPEVAILGGGALWTSRGWWTGNSRSARSPN